jgi:uncharacterized protein YcbK (DUF882 family)
MPQNLLKSINYHVSEHFLYSDFICPCCDMLKIVPGFYKHVACLEKIMTEYDCGFTVTSAYRCPEHNKRVGGAPKSWHMLFATDLVPELKTMDELKKLFIGAEKAGFRGLGLYDTHIHVDMRPGVTKWRG